jgi:hypothetical protein
LPFTGKVFFSDDQTLGHGHLGHVKIVVEEIVIKKFAGWAEHDVELDVFRFDSPVQERRKAWIPSANEF